MVYYFPTLCGWKPERKKTLWFVQHFVYKIILKSDAGRVGNGKRGSPLAAVCLHAWLHFTHPHWSIWRPWPSPWPSPGIFYLLLWLVVLSASPDIHLVAASSVVTPKKYRGAKEHGMSSCFYLGLKYPKNRVYWWKNVGQTWPCASLLVQHMMRLCFTLLRIEV